MNLLHYSHYFFNSFQPVRLLFQNPPEKSEGLATKLMDQFRPPVKSDLDPDESLDDQVDRIIGPVALENLAYDKLEEAEMEFEKLKNGIPKYAQDYLKSKEEEENHYRKNVAYAHKVYSDYLNNEGKLKYYLTVRGKQMARRNERLEEYKTQHEANMAKINQEYQPSEQDSWLTPEDYTQIEVVRSSLVEAEEQLRKIPNESYMTEQDKDNFNHRISRVQDDLFWIDPK